MTFETVNAPEEAEQAEFRSSPTILVDGRDPWAETAPRGEWSCRIYRTEHGPDGAPSLAQLAEALAQ